MDLQDSACNSEDEEDFSKALDDTESCCTRAARTTTSITIATCKGSRDESATGMEGQSSLHASSGDTPQLQEHTDSNGPKADPETPPTSSSSSSALMSRIGLNSHKAGMEGLDKAKINQIILETSKGSKYYENEVKREKRVTIRINKMLEEFSKITPAQKSAALASVDKAMVALESSRDLSHIIVHVDMDAFYAAVEMKDDPSLRDVPMAVGGTNMLSTSNYAARRYGVRAAMPGFIAKKLCPHLVIVPTHFARYRETSEQVQDVLSRFDPEFCPMGLDESYLDITELVARRLGEEEEGEGEGEKREAGGSPLVTPATTSSVVPLLGQEEGMTDEEKDGSESNGGSVLILTDAGGDTSCGKVISEQVRSTLERTTRTHTSLLPNTSRVREERELEGEREQEADIASKTLPPSHWELAKTIVEELRTAIHERTGLTASAGIAPNKMLAKVASDMNKPNGQYFVTATREGVMEFVQKLPIRKISGIGKVTERMLNALGVATCCDLHEQRGVLQLLFSATSSHYFHSICLGISSSQVQREHERKSISTERTFSEVSDPSELQKKCRELCQALAGDMRQEGVKGRTVTVKLKTVKFEVKSRASTLLQPVSSEEELYQVAIQLLRTEMALCSPSQLRLRLMGVRVSSLQRHGGTSKREKLTGFFASPKKDSDAITNTAATPSANPEQDSKARISDSVTQPSCSTLGLTTARTEASLSEPNHPASAEVQSQCSSVELPSELVSAVCPVCANRVSCHDNATFNKHIDECLNRPAIVQAVKASTSPVVTPTKKVGGAGGGACPSKTSSHLHLLTSRKRKATSVSDSQASPSPNKRVTLDHFWKS